MSINVGKLTEFRLHFGFKIAQTFSLNHLFRNEKHTSPPGYETNKELSNG